MVSIVSFIRKYESTATSRRIGKRANNTTREETNTKFTAKRYIKPSSVSKYVGFPTGFSSDVFIVLRNLSKLYRLCRWNFSRVRDGRLIGEYRVAGIQLVPSQSAHHGPRFPCRWTPLRCKFSSRIASISLRATTSNYVGNLPVHLRRLEVLTHQ